MLLMAGIRERDKLGRLVEDSSVWKILYHLCSLFAICSFRDCRSIEARIEPGLCRRPEAPIHFRRWPRGAAEPHFPPETLKTTPEHAEVTRCAGVAYSRRWQAYPFQVPAARHERAGTGFRRPRCEIKPMPISVCPWPVSPAPGFISSTRETGTWAMADANRLAAARNTPCGSVAAPPPLLSALLYFSPERNPLQCVIGSGGTRNE